jgi:hypothetical protein
MPKKRNKFHYVRQRNPHIKRGAPVLYDGQLMFVSTVDGGDVILRRELRVHPCDDHAIYVQDTISRQAIELIHALVTQAVVTDLVGTTLTGNEDMSLEEIEAISSKAMRITDALWRNYQTLPESEDN